MQPTPRSRLLLVGQRHGMNAALIVDTVLGLRDVADFVERPSDGQAPWVQAIYEDSNGVSWQQLDVPALLRASEFLDVAA
jgi:twitching motility protein PilI